MNKLILTPKSQEQEKELGNLDRKDEHLLWR